jgi:hypothetical protein
MLANLKAGDPVFRAIDQWQHISNQRLTDRSVARIVKSRVKALVKRRGRSEAEVDELVELVSGHSLRAGYATSAQHAGLSHPKPHTAQVGPDSRRLHSRSR